MVIWDFTRATKRLKEEEESCGLALGNTWRRVEQFHFSDASFHDYKSKITSLVLLRVFLWACYHASKLTNTRINLGSSIQTSVGLVYRWMHGINNQRQWTVSTNRVWVSNYDTCQILIFGGYVKVEQLLCTQVITWISNILNILILGRFYLGTKILTWWYINPIDIVNKSIVKSSYPTSIKQMWISYYWYANGMKMDNIEPTLVQTIRFQLNFTLAVFSKSWPECKVTRPREANLLHWTLEIWVVQYNKLYRQEWTPRIHAS